MNDTLFAVLLLCIAAASLWWWGTTANAKARVRMKRALDQLEQSIRADERRRAEQRFAQILLTAIPPEPTEPEDTPNLDDKLPWESR